MKIHNSFDINNILLKKCVTYYILNLNANYIITICSTTIRLHIKCNESIRVQYIF